MNTHISQGPEASYHYKLVRRAIERLDSSEAPMSLEDLAREMQLSPTYLQRLFSKWAGVSPKRYQQFLALDHAKTLLRAHHSTLDTAVETGLSGGGRLHDLFLRWEAMSPGSYAKGGAGLSIKFGWFDSPFGRVLVMGTDVGLCGMAFAEETGEEASFADLAARWPSATFEEDADALRPWVDAAFGGKGEQRLHLIGAPFQIKVWEALLHVPSGHVTTYSDIARAVGSPKAVRAVGTAVGKNPVSWLIPCHRALRKSGELGGYHWGTPIKRAMLAYESAQRESGAGTLAK
jgi:AraC family transcriptional regulator of adaptative response/methylated-DNA-[protein]-cysteine methyltransferase